MSESALEDDRLLEFQDQLKPYLKANTDNLTAAKIMIDEAVHNHARVMELTGAVRHTLAARVSRRKAEEYLAAYGKPLLILAGVFVVSSLVGATFLENSKMAVRETAFAHHLNAARLAQINGDHATAFQEFEQALSFKADPEECLFRMAECMTRLGQYEAASKYCDELDTKTKGKASSPLFCPALARGWIAEGLKDPKSAKDWYKIAETLGNPDAGILHRRIK